MAPLRAQVDAALERLLDVEDEAAVDPRWAALRLKVRHFALRPAKRVRPLLLLAGHALVRGQLGVSGGLLGFAAALELLHTFLLIHDDVADRARVRRGGPALHLMLGSGKRGEDLAVVAGDHLFARAVEAMLQTGLPNAPAAVRYVLSVCRHTAAGQSLDLELGAAPLNQLTLFQVLKVAQLKTARYGFVAPLVCGALLAGADPGLMTALERVGRHAGVAFQLVDDLLGLFGDDHDIGKAGGADFFEGKRTFPLVAAWARADDAGRARLESLWDAPNKDDQSLKAARSLVLAHGGRAATERVIVRTHRLAARSIAALPEAGGMRELIAAFIDSLSRRTC
ncbi:MAG: polyprenyl synthetase family protein [Myxococcaceae bacterium]|nr:polyprenyl synthetase family protein [Myxococcaceae bacterium]